MYFNVEILQTTIFLNTLITCVLIGCFANTFDLKKFFFFSEITWLLLFTVFLVGFGNALTNNILIHAFLILVLTACEAITLASFLLILSESTNVTQKNITN